MHSGTEWWLKHSRTDFSRRGLHIYMHEAFVRDFSQPVGCAFLALSRMCFFNTLDKKDVFASSWMHRPPISTSQISVRPFECLHLQYA